MKKKLLLLSTCAIFLFTGCFGSKNESDTPTKASDVEIKTNDTEGLELKTYFTENNEIIFSIKNTGEEVVDYINIDVAFYDKEGNLLKTEKQYLRNMNVNQEGLAKMLLAQYDQEGNSTLPYKVEIALNKTIYASKYETIYNDKIDATVSKTDVDGKLVLDVKNNSGQTLDEVNIAVVFYKDSKPIDIQTASFQSVGATTSQEIYVPSVTSEEGTNTLEYDEVKAIVNNASKYITQ